MKKKRKRPEATASIPPIGVYSSGQDDGHGPINHYGYNEHIKPGSLRRPNISGLHAEVRVADHEYESIGPQQHDDDDTYENISDHHNLPGDSSAEQKETPDEPVLPESVLKQPDSRSSITHPTSDSQAPGEDDQQMENRTGRKEEDSDWIGEQVETPDKWLFL